jgi:riboflavin synthase
MFTGIIEEIGRVRAVRPLENGLLLDIACARACTDLTVGASVAVDGVCQTVLDADATGFRVGAEMETLRVTTLGRLAAGDAVNLERAVAVGGRLDGHLVLGHVDGCARITAVRAESRTHVLELDAPAELGPYIAPKGCIALDGVSLTVGPRVLDGRFEVFLIPATWERTTLHQRRVGERVNVEIDVVARYVARLVAGGSDARQSGGTLSWAALERALGRGSGGAP